jgi:phosphoglycerate dehydrogenase-like enzyme
VGIRLSSPSAESRNRPGPAEARRAGSTMGIVGYGAIGKEVGAGRAQRSQLSDI